MKHLAHSLTYLFVTVFLLFGNSTANSQTTDSSDKILVNQVGYPISAAKKALIRSDVESYFLKDSNGNKIFNGNVHEPKYWELSGDAVGVANFSAFTQPGEYQLCISDTECSAPFEIGTSLYGDLADAALKTYYYSRVGVDIEEEFGGKWNWEAGHPDTSVMIHASAADENRPEGITLASPGGWYDAGDYGKYIVNSSITTWTILQSYALNTEFHENQNLNIPESGNSVPDILDEALVNLKWMMTMQDPSDGGLYHKLTTKNFDGFKMPNETTAQRFFLQKSTSATLDFASTMAAAHRIYSRNNQTELANKMASQAKMAWKWAMENPDVFYNQPSDVSTGAYPDTSLVDEWFWASAEMYLLTGDKKYKDKMMENYQDPITPKWDVVNALGVISILTSDKRSEFKSIEEDFIAYVDYMLKKEANAPYLISMDQFAWGSNSDVANDGMLKLVAYQLTGNRKYVESALNDLHYILGRNATGFSFVTGFGDKTPMDQHNRIMGTDGVDEPMPGFISGGPNTIVPIDCADQGVVRSKYPAASFTDTQCSYSTNETAINWNAPLVFLASGLELVAK
ncbi:MAG: glycoside hydrolase family 9 protein [Balneolaceae bacterium]